MEPGPVWVHVEFSGGEVPRVTRARVSGRVIDTARDRVGAELEAVDGVWAVDGFEVVSDATGPNLAAFLDRLHDVQIEARAWPDGELVVKFASGVKLAVPDGRAVLVTGSTEGAPGALRLCCPLRVSVEGDGVQMSLGRSRWLSRAARIHIVEAALHPDGSVALSAGAGRGAVRAGLKTASVTLSQIVRRSPRLARVRAFLRPA
ncbi:MAG: hypothetical protein ACI8PZ_000987 [Myxococcota bacterium]